MTWVLCLTSSNRNHLHTAVSEGSIDQCREETEETASRASTDIFLHGTWVLPVTETKTVVGRPSTKINDEREDDQSNDGKNLDTGKAELSLSIDRDCKYIQADDEDDDQRDPSCDVDTNGSVPKLDDDRSRRDFRAQRDGGLIPIIPAHSETHRRIDVTSAELRDGSW